MSGVEVRKVEETISETGQGVSDRKEVTYQLGAEIDGVWFPFITKTGGYVEARVASGKALQESGTATTPHETTIREDTAA